MLDYSGLYVEVTVVWNSGCMSHECNETSAREYSQLKERTRSKGEQSKEWTAMTLDRERESLQHAKPGTRPAQ